jgi:hypothetical protein
MTDPSTGGLACFDSESGVFYPLEGATPPPSETGPPATVPPTVDLFPTFDPSLHNWIGPLHKDSLSDLGKFVTLGPAPPGEYSGLIEGLILIVGLKKLSETPEGVRAIRDIVVQYLKTMGTIMSTLSQSSSAHVISCAINQYVACTIYQRMGMMSPHDATQTRAWLDHQTGEAMLTERGGHALGALTTLVNSTSTQEAAPPGGSPESAAGLAAFAKILAGA